MEWTIEKEADLETVAQYVCQNIFTKQTLGARVIGLYGNLGAGKTTFTKKLALALGGTDSVVSPTFILERDYTLSNEWDIETLAHIDAYRFDSAKEGEVLRIHTRLSDPKLLYVVEWPENLGELMPPHTKIFFEHTGGDTRKVKLIE
ncbi:MAG: tRNA (adenosine(37)-N6)-threonylcarbamoyltransferase complex ATPase subunit type 1 TsaE [Minisyncoccia bacterium]